MRRKKKELEFPITVTGEETTFCKLCKDRNERSRKLEIFDNAGKAVASFGICDDCLRKLAVGATAEYLLDKD